MVYHLNLARHPGLKWMHATLQKTKFWLQTAINVTSAIQGIGRYTRTGFVCTSKLASWIYSRPLKWWNLWLSTFYEHYPKVGAASNTSLWLRTGSLNWSRWCHGDTSARWILQKNFWSTGLTCMDRQRHYCLKMENRLQLNYSRGYISRPRLLIYSSLHTTHRPMGR